MEGEELKAGLNGVEVKASEKNEHVSSLDVCLLLLF